MRLLKQLAFVAMGMGLFAFANAYSVQQGKLFDTQGKAIKLYGVNWFGFETNSYTPHGLWQVNWKSTIQQMKDNGFNAVRLSFCPATLRGMSPDSISYSLNPDLKGQTSLQLLDTIVNEFNRQQIHILLDHHRPDCNAISELWYTNGYSEQNWIDDLKFVSNRYKNVPYLMGIDLKNEPHGRATWGANVAATDWNKAVERAASAVLASNPNVLIFVEGIESKANCSGADNYFWGGNITPVKCTPLAIKADRLVLSPHIYGPSVADQPYFHAGNFPANMPAIWETQFGFAAAAGYAVVPGEFGGRYEGQDKIWQDKLVDYLVEKKITNFFYWSWNPNSGDTGGVLNDDWKTINQGKLTLLKRLMAVSGNPTPTPVPTPGALQVSFKINNDWGQGYCADVIVKNTGSTAVVWSAVLTIPGVMDQSWNAAFAQSGSKLTVTPNQSSNKTLAAGATLSGVGFCAKR